MRTAAPVLLVLLSPLAVGATAAEDRRTALVAGEGLFEPFAVDFDGSGRIFVAEMGGSRISVIDGAGPPRVFAGTGEKGLAGDGGAASEARLNGPHHLLVGPDGALYVADTWNNVVRRIDLASGVITRVAGTGRKGFAGDGGSALQADFNGVFAIAFHEGVLYVCDTGNRRIRAVDLKTGLVTTVAGNGERGVPADGGEARTQPLVDPRAMAFDSQGRLYICERGGHALRMVDAGGRIHTVAGSGEAGFSGDGGPALEARFRGPKHIAVDADDSVLIVDTENHVIRRYSPRDGTVSLLAGTGRPGAAGLGAAPERCELNRPHGVRRHPRDGHLYVADSDNHRVIRIESGGAASPKPPI